MDRIQVRVCGEGVMNIDFLGDFKKIIPPDGFILVSDFYEVYETHAGEEVGRLFDPEKANFAKLTRAFYMMENPVTIGMYQQVMKELPDGHHLSNPWHALDKPASVSIGEAWKFIRRINQLWANHFGRSSFFPKFQMPTEVEYNVGVAGNEIFLYRGTNDPEGGKPDLVWEENGETKETKLVELTRTGYRKTSTNDIQPSPSCEINPKGTTRPWGTIVKGFGHVPTAFTDRDWKFHTPRVRSRTGAPVSMDDYDVATGMFRLTYYV